MTAPQTIGTSATLVRETVTRLAHARLEPEELFYEISGRIRRVVPYDAAGMFTLDPDSMLASATLDTNKPAALVRAMWRNELLDPDVNKLRQLAGERVPVASLSQLDAARLAESRRAQLILAGAGLGDELRAMVRVDGEVWGHMALYRESGARSFCATEREFVAAVASDIAPGLRSSLARRPAEDSASLTPGVVMVGPDGRVTGQTDAATRTLALMPGDATATLYAAATLGRERDGVRTRVRLTDGRWAVLDAAPMIGTGAASEQVAVTLMPPSQLELASLLLRLHGLTRRERQVAELSMQGHTTDEIAARLYISRFTVQDHVKAIYAKLGVTSRLELVALCSGRGVLRESE
jgi:DNA-binding CsgD family transcriptional regulator